MYCVRTNGRAWGRDRGRCHGTGLKPEGRECVLQRKQLLSWFLGGLSESCKRFAGYEMSLPEFSIPGLMGQHNLHGSLLDLNL